jgi:hypothetical protein
LGAGLIYRWGVKRDIESSYGALQLAWGGPAPWQELVEATIRPEIDKADEDIGEVGLGLDTVELAGLDQGREDSPVFGASS